MTSRTTISRQQVESLVKFITNEEIRVVAVFGIGDDKSPRPDAFYLCFFKKAWEIVGSHS